MSTYDLIVNETGIILTFIAVITIAILIHINNNKRNK